MKDGFQAFPEFVPENEDWDTWTSRLESYLVLQKCDDANEKRCAIIAYMGHAAYKKLHDKVQPERKPKDLTYEEIVSTVKKIYMPAENIFACRIAFRKIVQNPGEKLIDFEARLRKGCVDCVWTGDELQLNLMEQFIVGLEDKQLKQSVLLKSASKKKLDEIFNLATEIMSARNTVATSSYAAPSVNYV